MVVYDPRRFSGSEAILEKIRQGELTEEDCTHLDMIQVVEPSAAGCEDCMRMGKSWVHLRICLICGHVGCCDNSPGQHATKHYQETGHGLIQSFEPGQEWIWCYAEESLFND
jgi:uncharacterized UBP type Zn finger protein